MNKSYALRLFLSLLILTLALSACEGILESEATPEPTALPGTSTPVAATPTVAPSATPTDEVAATPTAVQPTPTETVQPEATPTEAAPTETPPPQVQGPRLAYVDQGDVYLWTSGTGPQQLTTGGGAGDVQLSPDGQLVTFRRDGHLWVVDGDGSQERQLTTDETFANIGYGDLSDDVTGVGLYRMAWLPGTHSLIFNTIPLGNFVGLILTDDLWRADADSGEVRNLLGRGEGGNFAVAPDASQLALITPQSIDLMAPDGSNRRNALDYSPVLTYSEYRYYASPVWAPDAASLMVAIPPADPLADPPQPTEIFRIDAADAAAHSLGTVDASGIRSLNNVLVAPDLSRVAFLNEAQPGAAAQLMLAPLDDQVGQATSYAQDVAELRSWSPVSQWFAFAPLVEGTPGLALGQPGTEPRSVGTAGAATMSLQWADGQQFVYLRQSQQGWDIVLSDLQGNGEIVAVVSGDPPAFDVIAR